MKKNNNERKECISGNKATAHAVRLARVQVIPVYPITPATSVSEGIAKFESKGLLDADIKLMESEHSSMAACIGASIAGARVFTATSSQGLLYMTEMVHWAAGSRLPIVMVNVNRAICAPWALWSDMNDSMSVKDSGWVQIYCADAQDVLDSVLIAYKLAEKVSIPVMVCYEGFLVSHAYEQVTIPNQEVVDKFLSPRVAEFKLSPDNPYSIGNLVLPATFTEMKSNFHIDMKKVFAECKKISTEFKKLFGRKREMVFSVHSANKTKTAVVAMGTMTSTIKEVAADNNIDVVSLKMFRPFPTKELSRRLSKYDKVVVIDRNLSYGQGGQTWLEARSALLGQKNIKKIYGYVAGLNGVDITPNMIGNILADSNKRRSDSGPIIWR